MHRKAECSRGRSLADIMPHNSHSPCCKNRRRLGTTLFSREPTINCGFVTYGRAAEIVVIHLFAAAEKVCRGGFERLLLGPAAKQGRNGIVGSLLPITTH